MTLPLIRVLLVDDHPPFRVGMRVLLEQHAHIRVVGEADSGRAALAALEAAQRAPRQAGDDAQRSPLVAVLDCQLPDMEGPALAAELRRRSPEVRLLALSAYDDPRYIRGMVAGGASGYLLKNEAPAAIVAAVEAAAEGRAYFSAAVAGRLAALARGEAAPEAPTAREAQVLALLARGLTNAEIAAELNIAERTAAYHVENLLSKLAVENRTEAVVEAIRRGWVSV